MSDQSQGHGWWMASDGKWYPPEQSTHLPPPPASPNRQAMNGCLKAALIAGAVVFVLGGGCAALLSNAADDVSEDLAEEDADKLDDARITKCAVDDLGYMAATVEITNNSSERSNYDVTVSYTSPDGSEQYATGDAFAQALAPGQKRLEAAQSLKDAPGKFKCEITDVFRFSDE